MNFMDFSDLTEMHIDALKEIANIGAGNAATALSKLLSESIDMRVPLVKKTDIESIYNTLSLEDFVTAVLVEAKGDIAGYILMLFKEDVALDFIKQLTSDRFDKMDEMGESVICEIVNIISGAYMNAVSQFTGLNMRTGVPAISCDMAGAVIPTIILEAAEDIDKILEIQVLLRIKKGNSDLIADFYYLPKQGSLDKIFKSIGLI